MIEKGKWGRKRKKEIPGAGRNNFENFLKNSPPPLAFFSQEVYNIEP